MLPAAANFNFCSVEIETLRAIQMHWPGWAFLLDFYLKDFRLLRLSSPISFCLTLAGQAVKEGQGNRLNIDFRGLHF